MKKRKGAIQYTKGHIRDINGCMRIIKEFPDYFTKKSYKEIRRCLRQNLFIVAKDNDSIIGFCCIKGKKTLVREIS